MKRFGLTYFVLSSMFLFTLVIASERPLSIDEMQVEQKIMAQMEKNKIDDKKLFYHYLLAARSLKKKKEHKLAIHYYLKALELNVVKNKNRLRAYLELSHYLVSQNELIILKKISKKTRLFINQHNSVFSSSQLKAHVLHSLDYFDVLSSQQLTKESIGKDYTYFKDTHYWSSILDYEFKKRMELGYFELAQKMFKRETKNTTDSSFDSYDRLVAYDLLNVLNNNKTIDDLKCKKDFLENKNINHYSFDICSILVNGTNIGKVSPGEIEKVTSLLQKLEGRQYLIPALNKLKTL